MDNKKRKFSWRVFISMGLFYSFIIIFLTGIILYLSPAGRIAHWVNWKLIGLTKEGWQSIHTVFSFLFAILSVFHLFTINWKVFWSYLKSKTAKGLNKKREFYWSSILAVLIIIGIIYSIPPINYVMEFGEYLTESWDNEETAPPIPHAETLTLNELSANLGNISVDKIMNKLKSNNINFNNADETLQEIADLNNLTPNEVYTIITKEVEQGATGAGIGNKSLLEFATENTKDITDLMQILKINNIKATKDQTIKEIASENDMATKDLFEIIK